MNNQTKIAIFNILERLYLTSRQELDDFKKTLVLKFETMQRLKNGDFRQSLMKLNTVLDIENINFYEVKYKKNQKNIEIIKKLSNHLN